MNIKKHVYIDENLTCDIVISDEAEALLAAKLANKASISVIGEKNLDISLSMYAVFQFEDVDEELLLEVAKRHMGLPLTIVENEEIIIREFIEDDFGELSNFDCSDFLGADDTVFREKEKFIVYINNQYRFYKYGMYALIKKSDNKLIGKVGLYPAKKEYEYFLAYHIKEEFRNKGYAKMASRELMNFAYDNLGAKKFGVQVRKENIISIAVANSLEVDLEFVE